MNKRGRIKTAAFSMLAAIATMSMNVSAASVVYEDVGFLEGSLNGDQFAALSTGAPEARVTKINSFTIDEVGTYTAKLADFGFPEAFRSIGLNISTFVDDQLSLGSVFGSGSFSFNVSSPGVYYASVVGQVGQTFGLGLYGVQVSAFAPAAVPLPSAILFLLSGLAVFASFARGGSRLTADSSDVVGSLMPRTFAA